MKEMLSRKKGVHFIGVGGIGMSALAKIVRGMGHRVSGSDLHTNDLTDALKRLGAVIFEGHHESHIQRGVDLVVYSSSIDSRNPEIIKAKRMGIPIVHRARLLAELLNSQRGIAITGTHGKTTTTSLISVMLAKSGYDPTVAIGGEVDHFHSNARLGKGGWMVAEADESDGTFAYLQPLYSVVTNIEMEHVDYYKRLHDVLDGYSRFVNNTKRGGALFYNNDDENVRKILKRYKGTREGWGLAKGALIYPTNIKMDKFQTSYKCVYKNRVLGTVRLRIPGIHNVSNSLAAILVGMKMGIDFGRIAEVLAGFTGAKRRFQLKFHSDGVMLIDDYAHHPTEIRAVIEASQNWRPKRLMAVFQPHRFTRTKYLRREFGTCFHGVDKLILTDIYTASERPISGVTIHTIYREVRKSGLKDVRVMKKEDIVRCVLEEARPGDMVLVMGAGDIKEVADRLARSLVMRSELRRVPGRVLFGEPLSAHTTFRIGGSADAWVEPRDTAALKKVLEVCDGCGWRVFVIGNGSNILARDEGWRGVVVCLSAPHFKRLAMKGERVTVGAGYNLGKLITRTCRAGLAGLESMVGIPGTIGGAIYMNAGGASNPMFSNIGACVKSVRAIDYHGRVKTLSREDLMFRYRSSNLSGYVILGARLKLSKANRHMLLSQVLSFLRLKKAKQVLDIPSAGCIFKNPPDSQFTAGQLIDMMGFKGMRVGGAEVSAKHANFIVNTGGATAEDVLALVESIRRKAQEVYRIPLELEVKLL